MRVLYVNWVDYCDAEGRGGGVSLYQRNLMAAREASQTLFLASGTSYDLSLRNRRLPPRWEPMRHGPREARGQRFEIINSGVMAPGHFSFGDPAQVSHPETETVFFDFLARQGPFDVVHFNNLEGLPAGVLRLKEHFPDTRVIFSLHNYYPFSAQVNLWYREEAHCTDFKGGANCVDCLLVRPSPRVLKLAAGLSYSLKRAGFEPGSMVYEGTIRSGMALGRAGVRALRSIRSRLSTARKAAPIGEGRGFALRRATMVAALNEGCDAVLCVSDAVRDIAVHYGVSEALARTCYIGTAQAEAWERTSPKPLPLGTITLGYLGYMRRDKGFLFLLDALEAAPDALISRLRLIVAARQGEPRVMARLRKLKERLASLDWRDGYNHDGLDALLSEVDVGLVPPLWADNLPQVAIEMHARHIPLLCSDMGGAQELARAPEMVFPAGDTGALLARLSALLEGKIDLENYWRGAMAPVTMDDHIQSLNEHYRA